MTDRLPGQAASPRAAPAPGVVGIVGVGNMGGGMARNLLARGWAVQVCDLVPEKCRALESFGALPRANACDVATKSIATVIAVVDAAQTREVLFGPGGVLRAGAHAADGSPRAVLLCPTIAPADVEDCAGRLSAAGFDVIDAPMSGGPARAADGSMSLMVACDEAAFARQRPLIESLSSRVFRVGTRPGDGARTKLVNNLLAGINLAGAAQALALARHLGLDAARTLAVIEQSSGQSWIGSDRMHRALAGDFAPRAHMTLLAKDTALAMQMARAAGVEPSLGVEAAAAFARAVEAGLSELDDAALLRLFGGA